MTPLDIIKARLTWTQHGDQYRARCPAHDDKKPSLSFSESPSGAVLLNCHAGCTFESIVSALGIEKKDLFPAKEQTSRIIATYDYIDEQGTLLYQSVRFDPKDFRQRRPDGHGGWIWSLGDTRRVLYRLPELRDAETVFFPEGEKHCDHMREWGLTATTNAMGADGWREEYAGFLVGKHVVILPDNDEPGMRHALDVVRSVLMLAATVKIVLLPDLPAKGDIIDWVHQGHSKDELLSLVEHTALWTEDTPPQRRGNGHAETNDAWKNIATLAQEREPLPIMTEYPCPDILWQGRLAQIADRLGKRSWEVWLGAICAMGATAQKNLHWHYYRPLYGMIYGLLISPTGKGKGIVADVCKALLPEGYTVRDSVQSGPALFPILARIVKDKKGNVLAVHPRPALLLVEEWTVLVKVSKMEFSQLQETLNTLFHRSHPWNISRSDSERGGGDRSIDNPALSICATTIEKLLRQHVTPSMVSSGFLNRYLIVPGSSDLWGFYEPDQAGTNADLVKGYLDDLTGYTWGAGQNVWLAYEDDARERLISWGIPLFEPIMNSQSLESESLKRLHVYAHILCLLQAWSEKLPLVKLRQVEATIAACEVSKLFVEGLMSENAADDIALPQHKQWEVSLEHKIIAKVRREPGVTVKKIGQDLRKSGTYQDVVKMVRSLVQSEKLGIIGNGKTEAVYPNDNKE